MVTALSFMSVISADVIDMNAVPFDVASSSSLLMRLRSSSDRVILICKPFVLLDSPPVRVYEVPLEELRVDWSVIAVKSRLLLSTGSSNSSVSVPFVKSREKLFSIGAVRSSV